MQDYRLGTLSLFRSRSSDWDAGLPVGDFIFIKKYVYQLRSRTTCWAFYLYYEVGLPVGGWSPELPVSDFVFSKE